MPNTLKTSLDPLATILQDTPEDVALNKNIQESIESKAGLEVAKEKEQATQKSMEAKGQENVQKEYARKVEEDPLRAEKLGLIEKQKDTTFVPTKETVNDLAAVFTLTNLLGFMIGGKSKGNAQAALAAQNGMLEGHQKGLQDVYKREKDIFDENQKALEKTINALDKQLTENIQLYATDRDAGLAAIRTTLAEHNAKFLQDSLEKYGPAYMYDQLMNTKKVNDQLKEKKAKLYQAEQTKKFQEKQLELRNRELSERIRERGQGTYQYVVGQDGKTYAVNTKNPNDIRQLDVDFSGATKVGAKPAKPEAGLGSGAFLESVLGVKAGDEKTNQKIVDTATGVSQLNHVVNLFRDPEVRTGVLAKLNPIREKLSSLGDDNHEISDAELQSIIDGEISPDAKNAVAQKEALFAAYTAEREIAGGRLLVSVVKQAGGALDPTNYEKSGYINLLNSRENELKKRLRGEKMSDEQIDKVVSALDQSAPKQPTSVTATTKSMPEQDKLKTYADSYFDGDVTKAKEYLASQGYK